MNQHDKHDDQLQGKLQGQPQDNEQRSENLLPGDDAADGRYDVAEEVNLDQQSDALRHVGQPPEGIGSDALPDALKDDDAASE